MSTRPTPSSSSCGRGPLTGLRVIEFAGIGPGPFAGMIVIERACDAAKAAKYPRSAMNRGKRSIALDIKSEAGRDVVWRLLASADALIAKGCARAQTQQLAVPGRATSAVMELKARSRPR